MNKYAGEFKLSAVRAEPPQTAPAPMREDAAFAPHPQSGPEPSGAPQKPEAETAAPRLFCDPWRIPSALILRSRLLFGIAVATALGAGLLGYLQSNYTVRLTLIPRETAPVSPSTQENEGFHPRQFTAPTLVTLMQSPDLRRRAAANAQPPVSANALQGKLTVEQVPNTDLVALTVSGKQARSLVNLANTVANQAVVLGRELQLAEADQMNQFCSAKLAALEEQLRKVNAELAKFQKTEKLADPDAEKQGYIKQLGDIMARTDNARIDVELLDLQVVTLRNELAQQSPVAQKLEAARSKLSDLLGHYTEMHPTAQSQRRLIVELEKQLPAAGFDALAAAKYSDNPQVSAMYARYMDLQTRKATAQREVSELTKLRAALLDKVTGLSEKSLRYATIQAQIDGLKKSRAQLANRQREAQLYQDNSQGYYRVFTPATLKDVDSLSRWLAALVAGSVGLLLGGLVTGLVIAGQEIADRRIKTAVEVQRATGLPVLASLGDLRQMSVLEKEAWAFRTWTAISGQLNPSPNHGIVCGFISSNAGEGRSTWIELLVRAAKQRGLQVMTIAARPGKDILPGMELPPNVVNPNFFDASATAGSRQDTALSHPPAFALARSWSKGPNPTLTAHIPLPGKIWSLAHRRAWQNTLIQMGRMENLVLLVELPPASTPEAVLLAESLPQVIWLTDSGRANGRETRVQLQTLRHAKCRLVGAVLNHEPKAVVEL